MIGIIGWKSDYAHLQPAVWEDIETEHTYSAEEIATMWDQYCAFARAHQDLKSTIFDQLQGERVHMRTLLELVQSEQTMLKLDPLFENFPTDPNEASRHVSAYRVLKHSDAPNWDNSRLEDAAEEIFRQGVEDAEEVIKGY